MKPLKRGARVTSGTVLGRVGRISERNAPHLLFEIRPAGRGAPRIDPKPILDGWKLLESTAIYRAAGRNPFVGKDAQTPSIGQILLMSKESLAQRVLADPNVQVYGCGRSDIRSGQIDRRVLATLEFLVASGLKPTVTSLRCGHSYLTASGNVSEHSTGTAVDIAAINGVPIVGHQGAGSIAELTVQRLLTLQGTMKPHQIISLMRFPGTDNTLAMARPRRPHPRRLPPALRGERGHGQAGRRDPQARAVDQADRAARRDRQPQGPAQPVEVRGRDGQARQPGPQGRVARRRTSASCSGSCRGGTGPDPGRYVVRRYAGDEAQQVVVIGGLAAPRRARRRARAAEDGAGAGGGHARDGGRRRAARRARRPRRRGWRARWATRRWRATPWPCSTPRSTPGGSPRPTRSRASSPPGTPSSRASGTARARRSPTGAGPRRASCRRERAGIAARGGAAPAGAVRRAAGGARRRAGGRAARAARAAGSRPRARARGGAAARRRAGRRARRAGGLARARQHARAAGRAGGAGARRGRGRRGRARRRRSRPRRPRPWRTRWPGSRPRCAPAPRTPRSESRHV